MGTMQREVRAVVLRYRKASGLKTLDGVALFAGTAAHALRKGAVMIVTVAVAAGGKGERI